MQVLTADVSATGHFWHNNVRLIRPMEVKGLNILFHDLMNFLYYEH